jgi:hypothetical protein
LPGHGRIRAAGRPQPHAPPEAAREPPDRALLPSALSIALAFAAIVAGAIARHGPVASAPGWTSPTPAVARQPRPITVAAAAAFDPSKVALGLTLVKGGFTNPLLVTSPHDGTGRLFVVEQAGDIRIISGGTTLATPFLDLRGAITSGGERGLLGLAFDPHFPSYPYVYVNFTDVNGNTAISRFTVGSDPNVAVRS